VKPQQNSMLAVIPVHHIAVWGQAEFDPEHRPCD